MGRILLKEAKIIRNDSTVSDVTDIFIENETIVEIAQDIKRPADEVIDCRGRYVSPGLTNLHTHSPMHMLRGLAEDVNINDWFNKDIWPYESKITEEDIYWGTCLACAEMIDNGVTAFADHYFMPETILKATADAGLRIDLAVTAFGLDIKKDIADTLKLIDKYNESSMAQVRFGPHSPYLVSPESLKELVEAAKQAGVGIHIHASETELQEVQSIEKYGKRHFQIISEAGGFDVPCIIAHGLWATQADFALVGKDTFVAACTKTYLKLGAGKGHLWENWQSKNLAIGTDGAASSNSLRPLEQAQYFALCGKWFEQADDYRIEDIWRMMMNGHNALNFGSGQIKAGAPADMVVWNLNTPATAPVYSPVAAILYSANSSNISHTIVAGNILKKDGVLLGNTAEILENAEKCAKDLFERGRGTAAVQF